MLYGPTTPVNARHLRIHDPAPPPSPSPIKWFARFVRALAENDRRLEAEALEELERIGFGVTVNRRWRKGGPR